MSAHRLRLRHSGRPLEGLSMQKIDPAFLFELGDQLREIRSISSKTELAVVWITLDHTRKAITQAVDSSVYTHLVHDPCRTAAGALIRYIETLKEEAIKRDWNTEFLHDWEVQGLINLYTKFETLFLGDLQTGTLYLVSPKGGFETDALVEAGLLLFSGELATKVPDATGDIRQATRCIAFELPTAAGFHLHRAHEAVLRAYWDNVTGGMKLPRQQNMGEYLKQLDRLEKGKPAVRSHLRSIKDFHRNPLMHPEQTLENVDQALDLLAAIRSSIGYMLKEIPALTAPLFDQLLKHAAEAGVEVSRQTTAQ